MAWYEVTTYSRGEPSGKFITDDLEEARQYARQARQAAHMATLETHLGDPTDETQTNE